MANSKRKPGNRKPISSHPLFPAVVALWFGFISAMAEELQEAQALAALDAELAAASDDATAEALQNLVYEIGKDPHYGFEQLRDWFKCLYETLLGSSQGPRMGSFIALYGIANTRKLIAEALG